jgi:hypothetical protein
MTDSLVRLVNLVEILKEELEDAGQPLPNDLTDEQMQVMTEAQIKQYYQQPAQALCVSDAAAASDALCQLSISQPHKQQQRLSQSDIDKLKRQFPLQDSTAAFTSWFPALFSSRAQQLAPAQPKAVVLCFHSSGNSEDMFTSEGTGSR